MQDIVKLTISTVIRPAVSPPTDLDELTDVTTEGAVSGQVLKYDGEKWKPGTDDQGSGGGSVTVVDDLTSNSATDALSANQGRLLKGMIPQVVVAATMPGDISAYPNGTFFLIG